MKDQIKKYFEEELTSKERIELLKEIENDREMKDEFIHYKNKYALINLADHVVNIDESRTFYKNLVKNIRNKKVYHRFLTFTKYAAAIALLIFSTYWLTVHNYSRKITTGTMNTLYVPAGQHVRLTLQDGTNVWLNAQSVLNYPALFMGDERRVNIEGEAFFEVAKDEKKPFIVSSKGVDMKVLGTSFNVRSYPQEDYMQTSLLEGRLKIYFPDAESNGIILEPNKQVTIKDQNMLISTISHPDYFLWKDGIYSFENELLIDILKKLEIYYDVKIIVKDPSVFQWEYTGKIRQRDGIDEILRMIQKIHKFTIEKDEDNNVITLSK